MPGRRSGADVVAGRSTAGARFLGAPVPALLGDLFRLALLALEPLLEVADPFPETPSDMGNPAGAEQHDDDEKDDDELWDTERRHKGSSPGADLRPSRPSRGLSQFSRSSAS